MVAVATLLVVLALSMLVVRVGGIALTMTGLSEEVGRFQAFSAFSGAGFTTHEAEEVVVEPARRRTVAILIRLGSVGLVTAIASLVLSLIGADEQRPLRLIILLMGAGLMIALARSRALDRATTPAIQKLLKRYTTLDLRDYADLLHLRGDYRIAEINVEADSWLADRDLNSLNLDAEGVRVLAVTREGKGYLGAPPMDLQLRAGDHVLLYGREPRLDELAGRHRGDEAAHLAAKASHAHELKAQQHQIERGEKQEVGLRDDRKEDVR